MKDRIWKDEVTGLYVCDIEVIEHCAALIRLQREFFAKRNKKLLTECKKREDGFLEWYARVEAAIANDKAKG